MVGRKVRDAALQLIRWRRIWTCTRTEPTRYRSTAVSCMVENTLRGSRHTALHTVTQTWVCAAGAQLSHPLAGLAPVEMAALTNHERLSLPRCASSIPSSSRHAERRGRAGRKRVEPTKDTPHWHAVTDAPHGEVEPARHLRVKEGLVKSRAVTSLRRRRDPVHLAGRRERHMPLCAKPRSAQLRLRPRGGVAFLLHGRCLHRAHALRCQLGQ